MHAKVLGTVSSDRLASIQEAQALKKSLAELKKRSDQRRLSVRKAVKHIHFVRE